MMPLLAILLAVLLTGCATSNSENQGQVLEFSGGTFIWTHERTNTANDH